MMKKIFSVVLMAVALLVGTNAWATTRTAGDATGFENAWKAAQDGDIIKLTTDVTVSKIFWLGTAKMNDAAKSLTLDLNGYILTQTGSYKYMFVITHGSLNVITSEPGGKIIQNGSQNEELFRLTGSTYKNLNPKTATSGFYSHLTIGEGVTVDAKKNAIVIDEIQAGDFWASTYAKAALTVATAGTTAPSKMPYSTRVYSGKGTANGVRVDVYGAISGQKYAFKTNGNLGSPTNAAAASLDGFYADPDEKVAYTIAASDVNYSPFVHIHGSADLRVPASNTSDKKPVAVYCSGYARWLIEGTCVGSTGVYVKSGDVDINDATIQSNYTGNYVPAGATNSGVTASGSAIVIESNQAYSGDIEVAVSGDSHVTATNGYAIDEAVTSATETKVDAITINGGTFEGGTVPDPEDPEKTTQGTIKITGETVENKETTVTVVGGEVKGTGQNNVNIGGQSLEDYLSDADTETHIVTVTEGGKTVLVITEGEAPSPATSVVEAAANSSVNWKNAGDDTDPMSEDLGKVTPVDLVLDELVVNQDYYQTLTIHDGSSLTADRVILGPKAKIVVKAGASFLVTGTQGITAKSNDNIVLETSSTKQAIFLVNPSVNANKHPKAKVQMYSEGRYEGGKYIWQRFGVPAFEETVTFAAINKDYTVGGGTASGFEKLENGKFVTVDKDNWGTEKLTPFTAYAVTSNASSSGTVYTFSCDLVGNSDASLPLSGKWNFYANSYTAPIDIIQMMNDFDSKYRSYISGTIYLYKRDEDRWYELNNTAYIFDDELPKEIKPMDAFAIHRRGSGSSPVVDYEDEVYNPVLGLGGSPAPARLAGAKSFATAAIEIVAADGTKDQVRMIEGSRFSAEYDNTYDAEKMMANEQSYIFADGTDEKLGVIATDNLEGTTLSMTTKDQTSFIMTVSRANGMNYAIRDMLTGTEIELVNGATYMFSVPANTTVDGRFQIVSVRKVATAIDNTIEEEAAVKGIYNMAGQYVGNDYHSLAAGVYVVDGKKIVK